MIDWTPYGAENDDKSVLQMELQTVYTHLKTQYLITMKVQL